MIVLTNTQKNALDGVKYGSCCVIKPILKDGKYILPENLLDDPMAKEAMDEVLDTSKLKKKDA
jgi:hypothetical protein